PPVKTVLVTSAQTGEGKTTTAANLATTLALLGKRVTLISADLRYPRVHKFFDVPNDAGLSQVLSGDIGLAEALHSTQIPHLQVLPSGPVTSVMEPVELLQSDRMSDVLAQCGGAEFVLIDGPPVLAVADSLALAEMVDGVLVVVNARKGKRALVIQARYQLRQVGGRLIGGVLNGFDSSRMGLGYYAPNDYRRGFLQRLRIPGSERPASKEPTTIAGLVPAESARGGRPKGGTASGRPSSRSRLPAHLEGGDGSVPSPTEPDHDAPPKGGKASGGRRSRSRRLVQAEEGVASMPGPTEPEPLPQEEEGVASMPGPTEPEPLPQEEESDAWVPPPPEPEPLPQEEESEASVPPPPEPDGRAPQKAGKALKHHPSRSGQRHPRRRRR
ncbi:MAG: CpsD/CapB family tyrosine-protein kinase, partial [Actinobacteria bacterium]